MFTDQQIKKLSEDLESKKVEQIRLDASIENLAQQVIDKFPGKTPSDLPQIIAELEASAPELLDRLRALEVEIRGLLRGTDLEISE